MRNHYYCDALVLVERFDKAVHISRDDWVKSRDRLVQKQHFFRRTECARQNNALLLTARKLAVTAVLQVLNAHLADIIHGDALFSLCIKRSESAPSLKARKNYFLYRGGKVLLYYRLLRKVADFTGTKPVAGDDLALHRLAQSEDSFHEGGFTRAVLADDTEIVARVDVKAEVRDYLLALIAERKIAAD